MELILLLIFIIATILFGMISVWNKKKINMWNEFDFHASIIVTVILFICILIIIAGSWTCAYGLPYDFVSADNTVDDTNQLLMKYENLTGDIGNIGNGLEANRLKEVLSDKIECRNKLEMDIHAYLNNPFAIWKGVVRERCMSLGIEI